MAQRGVVYEPGQRGTAPFFTPYFAWAGDNSGWLAAAGTGDPASSIGKISFTICGATTFAGGRSGNENQCLTAPQIAALAAAATSSGHAGSGCSSFCNPSNSRR